MVLLNLFTRKIFALMYDSEKRVSLALNIRVYTRIYIQHDVSCCCFGLLPWCAWPNPFLLFFFFFPLPFAKTHGRISQIWWSKCKCLMSLKVRMVASLSLVHLIPASGTILKPQQAWPRGPVFTEPASLNSTFAPQLPKLYLLHILLLFSLSVSLSVSYLPSCFFFFLVWCFHQ